MAQCVIDGLEAIEIDKQYGKRRVLALCPPDRAGQLLGEQATVRQRRKLVVLRKFLQLARLFCDFRHVPERNDTADQVAITVIKPLAIK